MKKNRSFRLAVEQIEDRLTPSGTPADVLLATQQIHFNTQILQFVTDERLIGNAFTQPLVGNFLDYVHQTNTAAVNEINLFLNNLMTQNAGNFLFGDFFAEHMVSYGNVLSEGVIGIAYARSFAGTLSIPLSPIVSPSMNTGGTFAPPVNNGGNNNNNGNTTGTVTDLRITMTDNTTIYTPGGNLTYTVVASNAGPANVTGASVINNLPANIASTSWTAAYSNGASGPASGSGNISALVNLSTGGNAIFTINAVVRVNATGNLVNTATVTVPTGITDSNLANNTATDTNTLDNTDAGMVNTKPADTTTGFTTIANGVRIRDTVVGTGTTALANSTVQLFYTGWLDANGTQFDANRSPNAPIQFALTGTIAGFAAGVTGMKEGGIRQIFIPSAQGYGPGGFPPNIPANADLVFEVKLITVVS